MGRGPEVPSLTEVDQAKKLTDADRTAIYSTSAWNRAWQLIDESPEQPHVEVFDWGDHRKTLTIYRPTNKFDPVRIVQSVVPQDEHIEKIVHFRDNGDRFSKTEVVNSHSQWTVYPTHIAWRLMNGPAIKMEMDLSLAGSYMFAGNLSLARRVDAPAPTIQEMIADFKVIERQTQ